MISGPAASGKTYYSNQIKDYYNLPRICVQDLSDKAFKLAKEEEPEEFGAAIKEKLEEQRDAEA